MKRASDVPRLGREVVAQAAKLSDPEVRFVVSNYYLAQEQRKRGDMQLRHLGEREFPELLQYATDGYAVIESQIKRVLKAFAENRKMGVWMMKQDGIAEVLSAGFLAHLTLTHTDKTTGEIVPTATVGHWYSFAGLEPDKKWKKGHKRPWNADLKQLCFHAGECFKRISYKPEAFYGQIYHQRKAMIEERNERGHYAERAKTFFTNSDDVKKVLAQGKLPALNLDRQACNYAVKIFLSHLHALWFYDHYGEPPPKPFAIAILGHAHELPIPDTDMFPGFDAAYFGRQAGKKRA